MQKIDLTKKRWVKPAFIITIILIVAGNMLWNYKFLISQEKIDSAAIQIVAAGVYIMVTLLIAFHEWIFTKKKIFHTLVPFCLVFVSIFVPILNLILILPFAYYLTIKNIIKAIKHPKEYGGLALSILALLFATVTVVKSVTVLLMGANGTITFS